MWFDPVKALAEIEAGHPPASAPPPVAAPRVAYVAHVARPPAAKPETAPAPCRTSRTPPTAEAAIPLDPEGLPFTACPSCGRGDWWKPAAQPFEGQGWACAACSPPPAEMWRHACAVKAQPSRPLTGNLP